MQARGMLLIAAPGQGAQTPGFLAPWLELPGFAARLEAWSELAGCDLIRAGTTALRPQAITMSGQGGARRVAKGSSA